MLQGVYTHTVVVSLNDLQEQCGSVLHWFGEDLQQVAIVVKVHKNMQLLQLRSEKRKIVLSQTIQCHAGCV